MECLYDTLLNSIEITESMIKLLKSENTIIQKHDKKSFSDILKEKNILIKKYTIAINKTKQYIREIKDIYPEKLNTLLCLTKELNNMCQTNYDIITKEFEITNKIIKLIKKSISESEEYNSVISAKI